MRSVGILVFCCLALSLFAFSQTNTGIPPFASIQHDLFDTVKLSTGTVLLNLPVRSKGGFKYSLASNIAATIRYDGFLMIPNWSVSVAGGPSPDTLALYTTDTTVNCPGTKNQTDKLTGWYFINGMGTMYRFPGIHVDALQCLSEVTSGTSYGYTMVVTSDGSSATVYDKAGNVYGPGFSMNPVTDPNGNATSIAFSESNVSNNGCNYNAIYTYHDPLKTIPMTETRTIVNCSTQPTHDVHTWNDAAGNPQSYTINYSNYTVKTNFGCSYLLDEPATPEVLPSSIVGPEGTYTLSYETPPGGGGVTGRISKITFPSGAYITYKFSGGPNNSGLVCDVYYNLLVPVLTRTLVGADGTTRVWKYDTQSVANSTVVTDPAGNDTVYLFSTVGNSSRTDYETQRQTYQGSRTTGALMKTDVTCYNNNTSGCAGATISGTILEKDVYTALPGVTSSSHVWQSYNYNGDITETKIYDFGASSPISDNVITYGTYNSSNKSCAAIGNYINNRVCTNTTATASGTLAQTNYTYDSKGNLTSTGQLVGGTNYLASSTTYNPNGTINVVTDVNGAQTAYNYDGSCNGLVPTSISEPLSLSRSMTWDCNGAVMKTLTDENGQLTTYSYTVPSADPYWRLSSLTAPYNGITTTTTDYYYSPTTFESIMNFGSSTSDTFTTNDGFGRTLLVQKREGPTSSMWDTTQYSYDLDGNQATVSVPCAVAKSSGCTTAVTTTTYDALHRPLQVTDGGGGTVNYNYAPAGTGKFSNDVLITTGPAPTGEHTKQRQMEYDSAGRLTKVCELTAGTTAWPGGTCAMQGSPIGYYSTYTYNSSVANSVSVAQSTQGTSQSRTYYYDGIGRLTKEINPETGTTTYTYDAANSGACVNDNNPGDLELKVDNAGNGTCYVYDKLHRLLSAGQSYNSPNASVTPDRCFMYDSATVNGDPMKNAKGQLAEAYTVAQGAGCGASKITDEGFGYSPRGEITDVYESTSNSGGYYHPAAAYFANGTPGSLSMSGLPSISYGADGEGRTSLVSASSGQNPVTSTSYNAASQVNGVTFGSGDSDTLTFDPNTGKMKQYQYKVNGSSEIGTLGWNPNGTLGSLGIVDPFNSTDSQNCTYAYDDLARLASAGCGSIWAQTFSYDAFGNVTKAGSSAWQPTYNTKNQYQSIPGFTPHYDLDGDLTADSFHNYTWNAYGNVIAIDSIGLTYDALGRMVEQNQSGTYYQVVYSPLGNKLAMVKGQTVQQAFVPLPGGTTAEYLSWGLSHYRHPDWLGSERLESGTTHTIIQDTAYAPFGEPYSELSGGNGEISFTGQNKDTDWLNYDFLYREYDPRQARWISPDPSGLQAVDFSNPQSFNRYAYVLNNPLSAIDPDGLACYFTNDADCTGQENLSGNWDCDATGEFCNPGPLTPHGGIAGNGIFEGENSTSWSIPFSWADLLGINPGGDCEFGLCSDQNFPGAMGITGNDWCGIGYHCDLNDISQDCILKAASAGAGLNSPFDFTLDQLKDKTKELLTSPAARATYGKLLGRKASATVLKFAGEVFVLYSGYDFSKKWYKTYGQCMDTERGGINYGWSRSGG